MFKRRFWGFSFLLLFLPVFTLAVGLDLESWMSKREIIPSASVAGDTFLEVPLDDEILANARPDRADLRVVRDDGEEIPYLGQLDVPVRITDQSYLGTEATLITFDLGRTGLRHFGLTLTSSADISRRAPEIESSDDGKTWVKLMSSIEGNTINYPIVTTRYLRVTIHDNGERHLIIAGALAHRPIILFRYELGRKYELYFGEPTASQPEYDLTALRAASGGRHWVASLGPKQDNLVKPEEANPAPASPPIKSIHLLIGIGGLTALVIGGLAYRLFKQTQV